MRILLFIIFTFLSFNLMAQEERDSTLRTCPVFITDEVTLNNYFIEARPAILKVYRVKGKLTVSVDQRGQLVSFYFHTKKLKTGTYNIVPGSRGNDQVEAIYSFRSGEQASFIALSSGTIDVTYDTDTEFWNLKINGVIANIVGRDVSYFKVKADLKIK